MIKKNYCRNKEFLVSFMKCVRWIMDMIQQIKVVRRFIIFRMKMNLKHGFSGRIRERCNHFRNENCKDKKRRKSAVYEQLLPDLEKLKKTEGIVCDDLDDYDECLQSCGVPIFEEGMEYYYEWAYRRIKLLGNPDVLQGRMEEECEGVTRGYYLGRGWQDVPEQEREEIWEKGKDWMLLFQVGTIDGYDDEYRWEYQGNLYFWIKKQDLKMRNFENVWLILQCL